MKDVICEYCLIKLDNSKLKANHIRWHHKKIKFSKEAIDIRTSKAKAANEKMYGKFIEEVVKCTICDNLVEIKYRENKKKDKYFCSRSCANTRKHSDETKNKIGRKTSITTKILWQNEDYAKKVMNQNRRFTSKGEVEIREYFINKFKDDNWTFGGCIKYKNELISRDLYSKSLKICIEYDGIWHRKDIHGQLAHKQFKDRLLQEWCDENGYMLIRINDYDYEKNKVECLRNLEKTVYNKTAEI